MLTRVAQDAERALRAVEQARRPARRRARSPTRIGCCASWSARTSTSTQTAFRGCTAARERDRIISTVDPEMRHGRKSQHQRFDGYKLSAAVTNTSKPLITAIEVAPASEQDGPQAKHLIDAQPQQRRPARVLGDSAYGTGPVRAELAEREVDVLAPVPEAPAKEGRLAKRDFHIDLDAGTVTCPAGQAAPIRTEPSGRRRAQLCQGQLRPLPAARAAASRPHAARGRSLSHPMKRLLIAARQALDDPDNAEHLRRTRPRIERLLGLLAAATEPAKADTSAAPKPDCRPPGPPPWSTSTPSPATSPPSPPDQPQRQNHKPTPPDRPQQHPHATSLLQEPSRRSATPAAPSGRGGGSRPGPRSAAASRRGPTR